MHAKSNNVEIMVGTETDEIIEDLFESLLQFVSKKFGIVNEGKQICL